MTSRWRTALVSVKSQYSVAVTLLLNVFLYAQVTVLIHSIYPSDLQRYTVAGLCGVAITVS